MTKFEFLDSLALKFGTDKASNVHGYTKYYAEHLPDKCRTFLEVGCAEGKSGLMWDAFYGKDELELHYIDLFENRDFVSKRFCLNRGWQAHKGDQTDIDFLYSIKEMFEVIVEDGSHNSFDQLATFKHLFVNNLKSGGLWVTEDLHCCLDQSYRYRGDIEFKDTFLSVLKQYKETGEFTSRYFENNINEFLKSTVKSVDIYDDKIAFIQKI